MNNTRIKYKLTEAGEYESVQSFLGNEGALLKAVINPTTLVVAIQADEVTIEQVSCGNFSKCKKVAKETLKKHGAKFFAEVRNKKETV